MRNELFKPEHKTNILPLRWLANYIFHPISMVFFRIGLRANDQIYESGEGYTIRDEFKEFLGWRLYKILDKPYSKWGTVYKFEMPADFKLDDGLGWDDYDENGIPYWEYFWHRDPVTNDAWRLIKPEFKYEDLRDGSIHPEIQKDLDKQ